MTSSFSFIIRKIFFNTSSPLLYPFHLFHLSFLQFISLMIMKKLQFLVSKKWGKKFPRWIKFPTCSQGGFSKSLSVVTVCHQGSSARGRTQLLRGNLFGGGESTVCVVHSSLLKTLQTEGPLSCKSQACAKSTEGPMSLLHIHRWTTNSYNPGFLFKSVFFSEKHIATWWKVWKVGGKDSLIGPLSDPRTTIHKNVCNTLSFCVFHACMFSGCRGFM